MSVKSTTPDEKTKEFKHNEAERILFELDGIFNGNEYGNWCPLPFYVDSADIF